MSEALLNAMDEVAKANVAHGVTQRGGKRYTMVQDRVLVWRRNFGLDHGVESEIVRDDGEVIQVRCIIRDASGRMIADGLAEELRGSSSVNKTSALENCQTSALGRALAAMGMHGGEFASANEMEKVERMDASSGRFISATSTPPAADPEPKPTVIVENIEDTLTLDTKGMTWAKGEVEAMAGWLTLANKLDWLSNNRAKLGALKGEDPEAFLFLQVNVKSREKELTNA